MENKTLIKIATIFFILFFILSIIWSVYKINTINNTNTIDNSGNITQTVNISVPTQNQDNKININTCSREALEGLPNIGKTLADRIIKGRSYKDIYELDKIKGINKETIDLIKDRAVVK